MNPHLLKLRSGCCMGLVAPRNMELPERDVHRVLGHLERIVAVRGSLGRRSDYVEVGELVDNAADERC